MAFNRNILNSCFWSSRIRYLYYKKILFNRRKI